MDYSRSIRNNERAKYKFKGSVEDIFVKRPEILINRGTKEAIVFLFSEARLTVE